LSGIKDKRDLTVSLRPLYSGVKQISGSVLKNNSTMLKFIKFIKQMGFAETGIPDDPSALLVTKHLD